MSELLWAEVARRTDEHAYMSGAERDDARVRTTAEIFTPTGLVLDMLRRMPLEDLAPGRTVLDPACGDGQFLTAVKWAKVLLHDIPEDDALRDLYGVDRMRDNVDLCLRRLGGGTVVMGDALHPERRLPGQSPAERATLQRMFAVSPPPGD